MPTEGLISGFAFRPQKATGTRIRRPTRGTARWIPRRSSPAWHRSTIRIGWKVQELPPWAIIGEAAAHRIVDVRILKTVGSCPFNLPTLSRRRSVPAARLWRCGRLCRVSTWPSEVVGAGCFRDGAGLRGWKLAPGHGRDSARRGLRQKGSTRAARPESSTLRPAVAVVPRHPELGAGRKLVGVPLQLGQVVERVGLVQLARVDQAHEQVTDTSAVAGSCRTGRSCGAGSPSSRPARTDCCPAAHRPDARTASAYPSA